LDQPLPSFGQRPRGIVPPADRAEPQKGAWNRAVHGMELEGTESLGKRQSSRDEEGGMGLAACSAG
jgi:hypothetical protein